MLRGVKVPDEIAGSFEGAMDFVQRLFQSLTLDADAGRVTVGGERYVLMRCESLYAGWLDAMSATFGEDTAHQFIYNTAREIGRSDAKRFGELLGLDETIDRLACGPLHFAHAGWARVEILADSEPVAGEAYYLHYVHPNTFESEVLGTLGRKTAHCGCFFSAGYSAGWCTEAFRFELHGREIRCLSRGDERCEFVMGTTARLLEYEKRALNNQA